jgi:hypothetical protein
MSAGSCSKRCGTFARKDGITKDECEVDEILELGFAEFVLFEAADDPSSFLKGRPSRFVSLRELLCHLFPFASGGQA